MNRRQKNKIAKQQSAEAMIAHQNAPLAQRVRDDIAECVAEVKADVSQGLHAVVADVKAEAQSLAPSLDKAAQDLQHLAKRVPLVGEAAAGKMGELNKRVQDQIGSGA